MHNSFPPASRWVRFVGRLRAISFFGLLSLSILLCSFWIIPIAIYFKKAWLIRWMNRTYLGVAHPLFGIKFDVQGKENFSDRTTVMVSNHQSWLDITTIMLEVRYPAFLAKKEIESWPFFGPAMKLVDCVFVDRNDRRSRQKVALDIREKLARGVDFCIFPEGTRSLDGSLGEFAGGAFRIAADAEALVTPVVIDNSWWMLNKKGMRMFPGTIRVRVLPPIDTSLPENRDYKELVVRVRGQMQAALAAMRGPSA
jgi:1-acyl-sn-glycerol-3-phosphate acyltransferase